MKEIDTDALNFMPVRTLTFEDALEYIGEDELADISESLFLHARRLSRATRSYSRLLKVARSLYRTGHAATGGASHSNEYFELFDCGGKRVSTVELDCLGKDFSETGYRICSGALLAIGAKDLFYPADPKLPSCFSTAVYSVLMGKVYEDRYPLSSRLQDRRGTLRRHL
jgi:hypothetical protein